MLYGTYVFPLAVSACGGSHRKYVGFLDLDLDLDFYNLLLEY